MRIHNIVRLLMLEQPFFCMTFAKEPDLESLDKKEEELKDAIELLPPR
jgi:hypothetical protein